MESIPPQTVENLSWSIPSGLVGLVTASMVHILLSKEINAPSRMAITTFTGILSLILATAFEGPTYKNIHEAIIGFGVGQILCTIAAGGLTLYFDRKSSKR